MKVFKLRPRLALCAQMVEFGTESVVDVGTDHAYLPIYLVKNNIAKTCVAVDRLSGPLVIAERNVKKHGVEKYIKVRLSEGLSKILPDEADNLIIAGIGAENMVNIISAASWLKSSKKSLILQPMTKEEKLREYLASNSFEILEEKLVVDSGKVYVVFKTRFCGKDLSFLLKDSNYLFFGNFLKNPKDIEAKLYLKKRLKKLIKLSRNKY